MASARVWEGGQDDGKTQGKDERPSGRAIGDLEGGVSAQDEDEQ